MNPSGLTPLEFCVVVQLDPTEEKTAGGIILTSQTRERDELAAQEGTLVAMSPHAFSYADDWPEGSKPEIGERVMWKRYDGTKYEPNGESGPKFKILNDKSIIAIVGREANAQREAA